MITNSPIAGSAPDAGVVTVHVIVFTTAVYSPPTAASKYSPTAPMSAGSCIFLIVKIVSSTVFTRAVAPKPVVRVKVPFDAT